MKANSALDAKTLRQIRENLAYTELVEALKIGEHSWNNRWGSMTIMRVMRLGGPRMSQPISFCGTLPAVISLLDQCEHDSFEAVLAELSVENASPEHKAFSDYGFRRDLETPVEWIHFLTSFASSPDPNFQLHIAEKIGPLVRCMCNDTARQFYKSSEYWWGSMFSFAHLIKQVLTNSGGGSKNKIIDTLLKHDAGLLRTIVQWGFYYEEYRPDVTKEIHNGDCGNIVHIGRELVIFIFTHTSEYLVGGDMSILESIGTAPIVPKHIDPACMISFTEGLICRMKAEGGRGEFVQQEFKILNHLIEANCVDTGIISEMISFGLCNMIDYDIAKVVAWLSAAMIVDEVCDNMNQPSDTRVAFAIRAGLIEMCLSIIERFGGRGLGSFGRDGKQSFFQEIQQIFHTIHLVSLHQKSWKAIRHRNDMIKEELLRLEGNTNISNNVQCKQLLGMLRSTLNMNGTYCRRCNKSLSRKEISQCGGCNRMAYCSISCQKDDWLHGGHNLSCCKEYTNETAGQFQGRILPSMMPESDRAAAKLKDLEMNLAMVQMKLLLDNAETILSQVSTLDIPLYDIVVIFDLRGYPLTVEVKQYADHFISSKARTRKDEITCIYYETIFNGELDKDGGRPSLVMSRFFPSEWLIGSKF